MSPREVPPLPRRPREFRDRWLFLGTYVVLAVVFAPSAADVPVPAARWLLTVFWPVYLVMVAIGLYYAFGR